MNESKDIRDYGGENSIGLCSIDVVYSTVRHGGASRRRGHHSWPRSISHMKIRTGKDSENLYEIIGGLKVYSDHSIF